VEYDRCRGIAMHPTLFRLRFISGNRATGPTLMPISYPPTRDAGRWRRARDR
jgi:hypothetical protein